MNARTSIDEATPEEWNTSALFDGRSHSVNKILEERETTYGQYRNVAAISQELKETIQLYSTDLEPYMQESLDMICNKIARILNGNPKYIDSWVDIAGYATLVVSELKRDERQ
jgi:hypothetical protein